MWGGWLHGQWLGQWRWGLITRPDYFRTVPSFPFNYLVHFDCISATQWLMCTKWASAVLCYSVANHLCIVCENVPSNLHTCTYPPPPPPSHHWMNFPPNPECWSTSHLGLRRWCRSRSTTKTFHRWPSTTGINVNIEYRSENSTDLKMLNGNGWTNIQKKSESSLGCFCL